MIVFAAQNVATPSLDALMIVAHRLQTSKAGCWDLLPYKRTVGDDSIPTADYIIK